MRKTILTGALLLAGLTLTSTGASAQYYGYGGGYGGGYGSSYRYNEYNKERNYAIAERQKERNYAEAQYYKDRAYNRAQRWKYARPYGYYGY